MRVSIAQTVQIRLNLRASWQLGVVQILTRYDLKRMFQTSV
jgi:hypothetical protein